MTFMILTGLFVGALLGFVLQRGRWCLTGGFRDMYIAKDNRMFYALLLAITVQSVMVYALIAAGKVQFTAGTFSLVAIISGAFVFGIGIILAGGCATGTWYRAGEGLIGSWAALGFYMLTAAMMKTGVLAGITTSVSSAGVVNNSMAETLHVNTWILIAVLVLVVSVVLINYARRPKVKIPQLKPKKSGLAHILFEKRWSPFVTAVLVGLIAAIAWPVSEATGRMFGLGVTVPTANILQYAVTGDNQFLNWGMFLVLGLFIGSFIAAKASGEFRWRVPNAKTMVTSSAGGVLMGIGASLAGGCSIGNGLVMTAMMTWQGWIALVFMILGVWVASYFVFVRPTKQRAA
ncbi:membrane protein [Kurthia sp. 3B1D]|uniref:Membrane protein n=1 Tax=Candidatus Kurthia intestinigallinarum TaxID=1562256 RepID=A0A433RXA9_9BACL|nr:MULTISPECIES: YeeE/YedE family protein [unclassified Kurthia]RUS57922.1 membrane protein [Kurthia sp. 3B1D]